MKALRAQSKARTHVKLAKWMGGKASAKTKDEIEDDKPKAKRVVGHSISVEGKAARPRLDRPGRRMKRAAGGYILEAPPKNDFRPGDPTPKDWVPGMEDNIVKRAPSGAGVDFDKMGHYEQPAFHEWNQRQQVESYPTPRWRARGGRVKKGR